jgi:hypothetical protein
MQLFDSIVVMDFPCGSTDREKSSIVLIDMIWFRIYPALREFLALLTCHIILVVGSSARISE